MSEINYSIRQGKCRCGHTWLAVFPRDREHSCFQVYEERITELEQQLKTANELLEIKGDKYVYCVEVCDYESCWNIAIYDNRIEAEKHLQAYMLDKENHEQSKNLFVMEIKTVFEPMPKNTQTT